MQDEVVGAMCREVEIQKGYFSSLETKTNLDSIYFGGGTPSLLTQEQLKKLLERIHLYFSVNPNAEITLEANPDDITQEKVAFWKANGINRLSIGIQSFREQDLKWMNRAHNAQEASQAANIAKEGGIHDLSLDLIYGIPGLSKEDWIKNIYKALEYNPSHLSCYALTVEENTPLFKLIHTKRSPAPIDENTARHFNSLMEVMEKEGWEHYEISNFCKKGHRAVHNSNYWNGVPYLGIGPSAHSYNGFSRQWNVNNNKEYLSALNNNQVPFEKEILSQKDKVNEYILVALRTSNGCDIKRILEIDPLAVANISVDIAPYLENGMVTMENEVIQLTKEGKHMADRIASDLFVE